MNLLGAVKVVKQPECTTLPNDAKLAWDKAMESGWTGCKLNIISYVGAQVVTGLNRVFLAEQELALKEPVYHVCVVTINEFGGECQITSIERLF